MKVSRFSDARKAFILKQGADGMPVAGLCRKAGIRQVTYFNWKERCDGLLPTLSCGMYFYVSVIALTAIGLIPAPIEVLGGKCQLPAREP